MTDKVCKKNGGAARHICCPRKPEGEGGLNNSPHVSGPHNGIPTSYCVFELALVRIVLEILLIFCDKWSFLAKVYLSGPWWP